MGFGYLAAGLLLSIMILPTIASVTIEVMRALPGVLREGVLALGFSEATGLRVNVLIATGLVLFVVTFFVNFAARAIVGRRDRRMA